MRLRNKRGFGYIEILIVTIIILLLFAKIMTSYFKKTPKIDQDTKQSLATQNIDTTNYGTIVDSTRQKVSDINKIQQDRFDAFKNDSGNN